MQPVSLAFAATLTGLLLAPLYSLPTAWGWGFLLFSVLLVLFVPARLKRFSGVLVIAIFFLFFANSSYVWHLSSRPDVTHIDQLGKKVTIEGEVSAVRQLAGGRTWLAVAVTSVATKKLSIPLESPLPIRLYLGEGTTVFLPGDTIRCRTRLRKPRRFGIPGEFHWPRYLASQHIEMTGWVKSGEKISLLEAGHGGLRRSLAQWRHRVAAEIHALMPENRAYLTRSLVLGEGTILPDDLRKLLARSGISHLFAISGLHLGMIALLGYIVLRSLYRRVPRLLAWQPPQRVIPLLLLPLLLGYLLLTGGAVSTQRALALAVCGALFIFWRYHVHPLQLLASLAFISLLINPLLLWQAGWQLSFSGAAGILLWQPLWQRCGIRRPRILRYLLQLLLVTSAASLATLPFVLLNFHILTPAGIVANLFCVPLVTLVALPLGFFALLLEPVFLPLSRVLFEICGWILDQIVALAAWLTALPGLSGDYLFLSHWQILAVGLLIVPLLLFPQLRRGALLRFTTASFLVAVILWQFPLHGVPGVTLTMLSVGQGESLVLQNRSGQTILIDGGGFYSDRFDVGERLLAPAFAELGIDTLDMVVLTHDDLDHRKGLIFILRHYPVGRFISGIRRENLHYTLRRVLAEKGIPFYLIPPGWSELPSWQEGDLHIFNGRAPSCSDNDASLVMYLGLGKDNGLLLTGDLEAAGVDKLLTCGVPGRVSILKLPHHGSRHSAIGTLLDRLMPHFCLVSSGYRNRYHLPAESVVADIAARGIPLYRTDLNGTVRLSLIDKGWRTQVWKNGLFH